MASQQANMAAALGGRDTSYLHIGSFNGFGNFHGSTPFQLSGLSNRTNPNLLGPPGLASGMVQFSGTQNNTNNPMNDLSKLQQITVPAHQRENLFQGIPTSLELDHLQQKQKWISESNNHFLGVLSGASNSNFIVAANTSLLLQGNQQQTQLRGLSNQPPVSVPLAGVDRFEMSDVVSAPLPDLSKCSEAWQHAASSNAYTVDCLSNRVPYSNDNMISGNMRVIPASSVRQINGNPSIIPSNNLMVTAQDDLIGQDMRCQTGSLMSSGIADPKFLSFKCVGGVEQKSNDSTQQNAVEPNMVFSSSFNSASTNQTLLNNVAESQRSKNQSYNNKIDTTVTNQPSFDAAFFTQYAKTDKLHCDNWLRFSEDNTFGVSKMQGGFASNNCNLDELMNAMIKSVRSLFSVFAHFRINGLFF